jgi:hypothetical protein
MIARVLHHARLDEPGFPYNATKETRHCALVQWSSIGLAGAPYDLSLARTVAEREASSPLSFPHFDGEPRTPVEQAQQLSVNLVYFLSPVLNAHLISFLLKMIWRKILSLKGFHERAPTKSQPQL